MALSRSFTHLVSAAYTRRPIEAVISCIAFNTMATSSGCVAHFPLYSGALQSPTYPDGTGADTPSVDKRYGTRNHEDALLERNR